MSAANDAIGTASMATRNTQTATALVALELKSDLADCPMGGVHVMKGDLNLRFILVKI
jgi:hypothetical protein